MINILYMNNYERVLAFLKKNSPKKFTALELSRELLISYAYIPSLLATMKKRYSDFPNIRWSVRLFTKGRGNFATEYWYKKRGKNGL